MDTCRSCGAEIRWVTMAFSSKSAPLNAEPDRNKGNVVIVGSNVGILIGGLNDEARERAEKHGVEFHLSHFATCPQREKWRKR